ncbi:MAG: thiamine diphosphokinase [Bacteroidetes bacterium]|uniref:Thiamine diphosphokinase n=1 Tax=Candidatus Cryptobacteroides excrementavium TaxID=2840759 RepID=A0A9D9J3E9_9BACT|nr:thiamine diphosphokinase [Candidatus Cryptobacteroides excrementavium]
MGKNAVIICNGEFPVKEYPRYIIRNADVTVCCDGAFDKYMKAGESIFGKEKLPDVVIGDLDSISSVKREKYSRIIVHDADQETNDQTKAFRYVMENFPEVTGIHIIGATGLRTDHTIGNVSLLMEYARDYSLDSRGISVDIISDRETIIPVTDTIELQCGEGRSISVFSPDSTLKIHSEGLVWPLDNVVFDNWWKATLNRAANDTIRLVFSHRSIALVMLD